jgi:hypothetical protein
MRLFCLDTKLNVSSAYLRPGFAFGGSCLPQDLHALTYQGTLLEVDTPVLGSNPREQPAPRRSCPVPDPSDGSGAGWNCSA